MDSKGISELIELFDRSLEKCKHYEEKGDEENLYKEIRRLRFIGWHLMYNRQSDTVVSNIDYRYFMCKGEEHFGDKFLQ